MPGDTLTRQSDAPRLLVLAEDAFWAERLGSLLIGLGQAGLLFAASSWEAGKRFCQDAPTLIFAEPGCLPDHLRQPAVPRIAGPSAADKERPLIVENARLNEKVVNVRV